MIRLLRFIFPNNIRLKKLNDKLKKNKKKQLAFKYKNNIYWSSNDTKAIGYLSVFFVIWFTFEDKFLCWFDNIFTFNIFSGYQHTAISFALISLIFVYVSITKIPKKMTKKYFIPYRHMLIPFSLISLYFVYRSKGKFSVSFDYFGISVLDLTLFLIGIHLFVAFLFIFFQSKLILTSNDNSNKFYYDDPIELEKNDKLGFKESVNEFFSRIISTISNSNKSLSIGIIGFWGEGKSSYVKLLMNKFKEKDENFIVIEYNPRYSKSIDNIQQEFFQILFEELKMYDIRFSSKFLDYLKAINVFESKNIFNFFKEGHDFLFDREDEKQKINQAIERINKKIIVFIDDLDRLIDDEVMEVIKLIHYNAALSNVIFITAYDKNYISQILHKYNHGSGLFTDKFFTIEKSLPFIPRESYSGFIIEELSNNTNYKNIDVDNNLITKHCKSNFTSLRDCKRFLNYFIDEYNNKKGSVDFTDFYLLSIICFKWNQFYVDIRDLKIVRVVSQMDKILKISQNKESLINSIILIENYDKDSENNEINNNLKLLLEDLFNKNMNEKSLNNNYVFDNYFMPYVNSYSNPFALESMFNKDINENITFINEIFDNKQGSYLIHYLSEKRLNSFKKETFDNYIDILLNMFCKTNYNYDLSVTITKLFFKDTSKEMITYGIFDTEEIYKTFINDKISNLESGFYINFLSTLLKDSYRKKTDENLLIFDSENILDIIKINFKKYLDENKYFNEIHLKFLYSCLSEINYDSNEYGEFILDKECCEISKKMIGSNPDFYLGNFIKKLIETSDPDWNKISCEPFYIQIFGSNQNFEDFISDKEFNGNNYINKIRNFWILFKHNNYQAVEFRHRGNIDNIIDGNFQNEVDLLKSNMDFFDKG